MSKLLQPTPWRTISAELKGVDEGLSQTAKVFSFPEELLKCDLEKHYPIVIALEPVAVTGAADDDGDDDSFCSSCL